MKKKRLTRTPRELKTVIEFLNGAPLKPTFARLWQPGISPHPGAQLRQSAAQQLVAKRAIDSHRQLKLWLTDLLVPELLVGRKQTPADRNKQTKFFSRVAPHSGLHSLVELLNSQAIKPTWKLKTTTRPAKIEIAGFNGCVVKEEFTHSTWQAVANLLETGEILKLGLCPICRTFFLKNRDWQEACNDLDCRHKYENQQSADRKAKKRRRERNRARGKL